jgi:hypothetical protein
VQNAKNIKLHAQNAKTVNCICGMLKTLKLHVQNAENIKLHVQNAKNIKTACAEC